MKDIYKVAFSFGFKPQDLWDLTYGEIVELLEGKNEQFRADHMREAHLVYSQAILNAYAFGDPKQMPKIHEVFPGLIPKPKTIKKPKWLQEGKKVKRV